MFLFGKVSIGKPCTVRLIWNLKLVHRVLFEIRTMWDIIQAAKGTQKSSQLKCYYFEIRTVRNRTVQSLPLVHALYNFYEKRKKNMRK